MNTFDLNNTHDTYVVPPRTSDEARVNNDRTNDNSNNDDHNADAESNILQANDGNANVTRNADAAGCNNASER